jgi:hypothetical protein
MENRVVRVAVGNVVKCAVVRFLLLGTFLLTQSFTFATQSVTLAWDPSPDPTVVGYKVYYGVASLTYTNVIDVGDATSVTISNLVEGTTYYFAATAYNILGMESAFSAETVYTVPAGSGNQPPTLNAISNLTINEDAGQQTVNLSGITSGATNENQTLTVGATSSNTGLIPNPTVTYTSPNTTGTLTFTPVANAYGLATITVTVNDGGASNNTVSRTFTVTVNAVNDPPTLNAINNLTISENAGQQTVSLSGISSGATNENQTLTVGATSSNTGLIPNPTVTYTSPNTTGTLKFTPVANAYGSATITVTVNDGGATNNIVTRTFTVTVNSVNQPPTLNAISNLTISENAGQQTVNLSGISSGATNENQTLTVGATSSNTGLIPNPTVTYTSPNTTGTLTFTPVANAYGSATITVTVNDGGATNNIVTRTFTVTVNSPPTITSIPNQTIATNKSAGPIPFVIGDAQTSANSLALWASSSATTLIPTNRILFGGSASNRTVTLTPQANQSGTANITITVSDGSATASTTFQLTVLGSPAPPGAVFIITTNGAGIITPNLDPQKLVMGKTYSLTAIPAAGQEFAGWTGTYNSSNPQLTFLMSSNVVLQANFKASKFNPMTGTYSGLFYQDDEVRLSRSGFFSVSATKRGAYSGYIQLGAQRYPISGRLDEQGQTAKTILRRNDSPLALNLWIGSGDDSDQIFGRLTNETWLATLVGDRAVFNARTNPAPFAGKFTMRIPGQLGDPSLPAGDGFGTVSVGAGGRALFAGKLADGTLVSQSAMLSKDGMWPLYVPLQSGDGLILSWLAFTNLENSDFSGSLSWIKSPNEKAQYYPGGFTNECLAVGSSYVPPVGANILNLASAQLEVAGGNFICGFTNCMTLGKNSKVTSDDHRLAMSFALATGIYRGTTTDPNGKSWPFKGAVLQKMNEGYGFALGTDQSSAVVFQP